MLWLHSRRRHCKKHMTKIRRFRGLHSSTTVLCVHPAHTAIARMASSHGQNVSKDEAYRGNYPTILNRLVKTAWFTLHVTWARVVNSKGRSMRGDCIHIIRGMQSVLIPSQVWVRDRPRVHCGGRGLAMTLVAVCTCSPRTLGQQRVLILWSGCESPTCKPYVYIHIPPMLMLEYWILAASVYWIRWWRYRFWTQAAYMTSILIHTFLIESVHMA